MDAVTIERRLEMLKLEGNGLEPSEIVKELSVKYGVTERAVYKDFETRNRWQPLLQEMKKALLKIHNRHENCTVKLWSHICRLSLTGLG